MSTELEPVDSMDATLETKKNETNGKRKTLHLLLTERDLDFLTALHDHVVLSFKQIHEMFFGGRSQATAMNRIKRIENQKLIARIRVPRLRVHGRENATGVVFQLTPEGRKTVSKFRPEVNVFEKCPHLNLYQLDHDLLVADIADHFKKRYPGYVWVNGRYLNDLNHFKKVPDAILEKTSTAPVIAIELELTCKSHRRYREIIANLKASRGLEKVIFVTSSLSIGRTIMSAIEGYQVKPGHRLSTNFFEFVRLSDCLEAKSA